MIRVSLADGVSLATGEEVPLVHVPARGTFLVDPDTFLFLGQLRGRLHAHDVADPGNPDIESETTRQSLATLQAHGIIEVHADAKTEWASARVDPYRGELADLLVRHRLASLTKLVGLFAGIMAKVSTLPTVTFGSLTLLLTLVACPFILSYDLAYAGLIHSPLIVITLTILLSGFRVVAHELGHATAAKRNGVDVKDAGVGIYLGNPVLYVNLSEMDTRPRRQRLHVDLGGMAVDGLLMCVAVVSVAMFAPSSETANAVTLNVIMACIASLNPVTKSDINWFFRDLLGARAVTVSWGRPRQLLKLALVRDQSPQRRFARGLVVASLCFGVLLMMNALKSIQPMIAMGREARRNPALLAPLITISLVSALGIYLTSRALSRSKR